MEELNVNIQPQLRKKLYQKAAANRIPINGTFELTPRCNMNCRMCYIRMSEEEMQKNGREYTAEEWISMGRICRDAGMLFLLITGGEPFLRRDFKEIYTGLSELGLILSINSNGTMIREDTVEWLKQYPPSKINITLYGASNHTYNTVCHNPKGFDQVTQSIDLLQRAGIAVGINASFTPDNVKDMEAIYAFAKDRGISVKTNIYMFPPLRKDKETIPNKNARFAPDEAGEALFRSKKCQMNEEQFAFFIEGIRRGVITVDEEEECTRITDEKMGCMAGRCSFSITWDGRMTPCGLMNFPVAYPFQDGFLRGWDYICREIDKIFLPSECSTCKNRFSCNICGALTIAEGNGDSMKKPEYMCKMTERYLQLCTEYMK